MASYCSVSGIASGIFEDLGNPSDISVTSISSWIRNNIGQLNNQIFTNYGITGDLFINDTCPDDEEKVLINKNYNIYYYGKVISSNLGASAFSAVQEIDSDGGKVKMINKTELAKIYKDLKKQEYDELNKLINDYRLKNSSPQVVHGDDTETEEYNS